MKNNSYIFLKNWMTERKWDVYHHTHVVYYCIKHNLSEDEALKYITEQVNKCEKMLKNRGYSNTFYSELEPFKNVLNYSDDDFVVRKRDTFQKVLKERNGRFGTYQSYEENNDMPISIYCYDRKNRDKKDIYKQVSEHTLYLLSHNEFCYAYKTCTKNEYREFLHNENENPKNPDYGKPEEIKFNFGSTHGGTGDTYSMEIQKKNYVESIMSLWHLIKTLDYVEC